MVFSSNAVTTPILWDFVTQTREMILMIQNPPLVTISILVPTSSHGHPTNRRLFLEAARRLNIVGLQQFSLISSYFNLYSQSFTSPLLFPKFSLMILELFYSLQMPFYTKNLNTLSWTFISFMTTFILSALFIYTCNVLLDTIIISYVSLFSLFVFSCITLLTT